jgi:leucyl aminopeptidase
MDFELKSLTPHQTASTVADALLVLWPDTADQAAPTLDDPLTVWARGAVADGDLAAGAGQCLAAHRLPGIKPRRVVLARCGDGSPAQARKAVQAAWGLLKSGQPKTLLVLAGGASGAAVAAAVQALADAAYVYTATKSQAKPCSLHKVTLAVSDAGAVRSAFDRGVAVAHGVELAKEWANRPGNHATPSLLAEAARRLAKQPRVSVDVLGPKDVAKLGMGAFLAVAQGSEEPLRFIVLKYQGAAKSSAPVVLVGKGITFDTGGISIKPAPEMDEMKFDMGGAASVLGTFAALAELQPAINVIGLVPSCENMPDGRAVKPGDVVTSMSGQTIEVLNTDAEGRLILCDALTYAERFKPRALIDIATLTGACVIALGAVRSGLFSNHEELAAALLDAGQAALDPTWRMPLDDDYAEGLKSNFADMGNVGGRPAGAGTAANFLQKFVGEHGWAHLDIAGVAWKGGAAKGATGRPVPLLVQYLLDEAGRQALVPAGQERGGKTARAPKRAKAEPRTAQR